MFAKSEKKTAEKIDLEGSELSKLRAEELVKIFKSLPESIITLDLRNVNPTIVKNIKETLSDAGVSLEGQEKSAESKGPQ